MSFSWFRLQLNYLSDIQELPTRMTFPIHIPHSTLQDCQQRDFKFPDYFGKRLQECTNSSCVPLHTQTRAQKADSKTKISFNLVKA
jgi:hypothetical protein